MSFKITPSYQFYVISFITIFLFLAATNVQGGWLYIIDSLLLSLLVFSVITPINQTRKLKLSRVFTKSVYEDESLDVEVHINNSSARMGSFIEVADTTIRRKNDKYNDIFSPDKAKFFIELQSKEESFFKYSIKPEIRGIYLFDNFIISSYGPFGLIKFSRNISVKDELIVYPNLPVLSSLFLSGIRGAGYRYSSKTNNNAEASVPYNVREYRRGDSRKLVHWKSTARQNKLMVKELESEQSLSVQVIFDNEKGLNSGEGKESSFEYFVKFAGAIVKLCIEKNHKLDFIFLENNQIKKITEITPMKQILDELAYIDTDSKMKVRDILKEREISHKSVIIPFFLKPTEEDINLLQDMYKEDYSVIPIFADTNSFDKNNFPVNDLIKKCPFKYINIKKGEKLMSQIRL